MNLSITKKNNLLAKFFCPLQSLFQRPSISVALRCALQDLITHTHTGSMVRIHEEL